MKIAYLVYNLDISNGWGRYVSSLVHGMRKAGHEVVIMKMVDDGREGHVVLKRGLGMLSCVPAIRRLTADCDIVHAIDVYPYGIIAFFATLGTPRKFVISLLGTYSVAPLYHWRTSFLSKLALKKAGTLIAISHFTKHQVNNAVHVGSISVIPPGIDFNSFYRERQKGEEYMLSVGSLKPRKGYHISIAAFALAKKKTPHLKYIIVGNQDSDRNYTNRIRKLIEEKGLTNDVVLQSHISDDQLKHLYATAKAFVLTSVNEGYHFEGFGIVFLEAAAAGLPVIGTTGNGIPDAVENGRNGILVPQNDISATAQAILDIVGNDERWQEMSAESYRWAKQNDINSMIQHHLVLYRGRVA